MKKAFERWIWIGAVVFDRKTIIVDVESDKDSWNIRAANQLFRQSGGQVEKPRSAVKTAQDLAYEENRGNQIS